jgi:hypothetical protein
VQFRAGAQTALPIPPNEEKQMAAEEKKKYRVLSPVIVHRKRDDGTGESYRAEPGEIVELSEAEAEKMPHAVELHEEDN